MAIDQLIDHRGKCQLQIIVTDIKHRAFAGVGKMRVACPGCVFPVGAGMDSSAEGVPTFAADNLAGKSIALLIFSISLLDSFFTGSLFNQVCGGFKILMADNPFMVICHIVLIEVTVILMPIKIAVGIGFLENAVTSVLFILDDAANATGGPVAAFLGRNLLLVQFFSDGLCAFPGKKLSKDALYDFCLRRIYQDLAILPDVAVGCIGKLVCPIQEALLDAPFAIFRN